MKKWTLWLALAGALLLIASFLPWPAGVQESVAGDAVPDLVARGVAPRGPALFQAKGCGSCHRHEAVAGAQGTSGPDLTHYEADPAFLRRWLADPQAVRPDTQMPNLRLGPEEIETLIAFLGAAESGTE